MDTDLSDLEDQVTILLEKDEKHSQDYHNLIFHLTDFSRMVLDNFGRHERGIKALCTCLSMSNLTAANIT
jgi:hypothetical protein